MTISQKREAVAKAYPGEKWASRVRKMPDEQVHTVYMRLMNAGKL
ncbi:hypothetical protein SEA_MEDIUMFRY_49 [Arthrobacter phage MediumFry]|nr:hypothetical protein SEA_CATERPILLAR_48 [Arthrobacter phage Caterpillar]AXH44595.1 hypothetical protein SEA_MEDIUMFRY_49 [Arthrobacter phage MediumFry]